jgi:hypothetical protein
VLKQNTKEELEAVYCNSGEIDKKKREREREMLESAPHFQLGQCIASSKKPKSNFAE